MSRARSSLITIDEGGAVTLIYEDRFASLLAGGTAYTRRASHVEPAPGGWTADLSPIAGPVLGPFPLRQDALDAERAYINARLEEGTL